jgi:hypothetical protein
MEVIRWISREYRLPHLCHSRRFMADPQLRSASRGAPNIGDKGYDIGFSKLGELFARKDAGRSSFPMLVHCR